MALFTFTEFRSSLDPESGSSRLEQEPSVAHRFAGAAIESASSESDAAMGAEELSDLDGCDGFDTALSDA